MKQRLIRVLVYEGDPSWIAEVRARRGIKGSYKTPNGLIREIAVESFPVEATSPEDQEKELACRYEDGFKAGKAFATGERYK